MAQHHVDIIYFSSLNMYYTGITGLSGQEILKYHLSGYFGFTSKSNDWIIVFTIKCNSISVARKLEKRIKGGQEGISLYQGKKCQTLIHLTLISRFKYFIKGLFSATQITGIMSIR